MIFRVIYGIILTVDADVAPNFFIIQTTGGIMKRIFYMSRQIQIRRGTTSEHETFTGAIGEITMDTDAKTLRVHDGETAGGVPLARADSVPDMSGADYVVAWQSPSAENNYTWYRKYKSGWVEQGGYSNSQTITLIVEMADTGYSVQLTGMCSSSNNNVYVHGWRDKTVSGFITQSNVLNSKSETSASNTSAKHWYVCGFSA